MSIATQDVRAEDALQLVAAERMARQGVRPTAMAVITQLPLSECEAICTRLQVKPRPQVKPPRPERPKRPEKRPRIPLGDLARQKMQEWARDDALMGEKGGAS